MEFDLAQADALLSTTRAVRKRLDLEREVPDEILLECLDLAIQAPTGSNRQGWRFMVVRDAEKKAALAEMYRQVGGAYLAEAGKGVEPGSQTGRVMNSAQYLAENLQRVPVFVIPLIIGRPEELDTSSVASAAGFWGSIVPAIWSFQLALRSRGLGSAYTTLHLGMEKQAAELLGIPDHMTQAALIPVAWTIGTDFKPATREPVSTITYLDSYKNPILASE